MEYDAISNYRDIAGWWDDCPPQRTISWSIVREAKATKTNGVCNSSEELYSGR